MIRFARPELLHLLWILPVLGLIIWLEFTWRTKAMQRWANQPLWDTVLPHRAQGFVLIKRCILVVVVGLLILAVAGPQIGTRMVEVTREGTDIALAVDVSNSMLVEDLTPNRMLKMRHEVSRFLDMLAGDRVALVPFAGVAFIQVPLTLDYAAVMSLLSALEPGIIPQPGTTLAEAIRQSMKAFHAANRDSEDPSVQQNRAQKIIVLITDGEDNEPGAKEAAKEAAKEGIIIYTIGMASAAGGPIPEKDSRDRITGYKKDNSGGTVVSRLNEELLADIASATGGSYLRATRTGEEFVNLNKKISGQDKETFEETQYTDYEDRFQWPVALAMVLMVLEEFIPPGRRRKNG